jgi:hypothetical protein
MTKEKNKKEEEGNEHDTHMRAYISIYLVDRKFIHTKEYLF